METELKICPFCGAKPEITDIARTRGGLAGWVTCPDCHCEGPAADIRKSKSEVIAAWNRRAPAPEQSDWERAESYLFKFCRGYAHTVHPLYKERDSKDLASLLAEVRAEERERCARVAESLYDKTYWDDPASGIAAAIRKGE